MKSDWLQRLVYAFAACVVSFSRLLPTRWVVLIAHGIGNLMYLLMPNRRRVGLENITRAFGDSISLSKKKKILRLSIQNMVVSIMDLVFVDRTLKNCKERFIVQNQQHMDEAKRRGKGIIIITSHLGSWEYLSFLPLLNHIPASVIVKSIRNPYMNNALSKMRQRMKLNPIEKNASTVRKSMVELKANKVVGIIIDQWASDQGLWLDFFGEPTSTTSIPARLAHKTKATLLPGFCIRDIPGETYKMIIKPIVDVDFDDTDWEINTTIKLNQILEEMILEYPEQWNWLHKRWKPKPKTTRSDQLKAQTV